MGLRFLKVGEPLGTPEQKGIIEGPVKDHVGVIFNNANLVLFGHVQDHKADGDLEACRVYRVHRASGLQSLHHVGDFEIL